MKLKIGIALCIAPFLYFFIFVLLGGAIIQPERTLITEFTPVSIRNDDVTTIKSYKRSSSIGSASLYRVEAVVGDSFYTLNLPIKHTSVHLNADEAKLVQYCPRLGWYGPVYLVRTNSHTCIWDLYVPDDELPWNDN